MTTSCGGCGTALEPVARPTTEARHGPVTASCEPHRRVRCPTCTAGDGADVLLARAVRRAVDERFLIGAVGRRTARCGDCDAPLDLPMRATSAALTVEAPEVAPFSVTVALPLVRCGSCARDNVPPDLAGALHRACAEACGVPVPDDAGPFRRLRRRVGRGSPGRPSRP